MTDRPRSKHKPTIVVLCAGLVVAGVVLIGWALMNQSGEPPTPDESLSISQVDSAGPAADGESSAAPTGAEPTSEAPTTAASEHNSATEDSSSESDASAPETPEALPTEESPTSDVEPLSASEPTSIEISAIDVTSPLHPLGLRDDGTLDVPSGDRFDEAAWYDGSVTPGEAGVSVIEGHVTSGRGVPSIFFDLGALEPGDRVEVDRADGSTATFEVYALDTFPKDGFPTGRVFGNSTTPELRLITCGGDWDEAAQAHVDNIVVFAEYVG